MAKQPLTNSCVIFQDEDKDLPKAINEKKSYYVHYNMKCDCTVFLLLMHYTITWENCGPLRKKKVVH